MFLRVILYIFGAVIAISFLKGVMGIVGRVFSEGFGGSPVRPMPKPQAAVGHELKKCSVCGVYAPPFAKRPNGKEFEWYCSAECEAKRVAASA